MLHPLEITPAADGSCVLTADLHGDGRRARIAEVYGPDRKEYARLFAAAKELLAALIELESGHSMAGAAVARAAIAKALGTAT